MFETTVTPIATPPDPTQSGYRAENGWWEDTSPDGWEPNEIRSVSLPRDLESIPAGPELADKLARLDRSRVCGYDLVRVLKARERLVSHFQAEVARDMDELSRVDPDDRLRTREGEPWEFAADEIRAALCLTRYAAESRLYFARRLVESFPKVLGALSSGSIDWARARVIVEGVANVDAAVARNVVDEVMVRASDLTTGQLRAWIRRLCIDVDPQKALERYERAVEDRSIYFLPTDDGTVDLYARNLPVDRAQSISDRINQILKGLERSDDRTHDQIRADIFLDLLDGGCHESDCGGSDRGRRGDVRRAGSVNLVVDLATLVGLNERAAEIPGYGPVISDIARRIAATQLDSPWNVTVTDQGRPVATGTTSYRPSNGMLRLLNVLNPTCVFPGCRMPANDCDMDHNLARVDGGETEFDNLSPKCRHDHRLKHEGGWTYSQTDSENGWAEHRWTSPLGHTYVTTGQSP